MDDDAEMDIALDHDVDQDWEYSEHLEGGYPSDDEEGPENPDEDEDAREPPEPSCVPTSTPVEAEAAAHSMPVEASSEPVPNPNPPPTLPTTTVPPTAMPATTEVAAGLGRGRAGRGAAGRGRGRARAVPAATTGVLQRHQPFSSTRLPCAQPVQLYTLSVKQTLPKPGSYPTLSPAHPFSKPFTCPNLEAAQTWKLPNPFTCPASVNLSPAQTWKLPYPFTCPPVSKPFRCPLPTQPVHLPTLSVKQSAAQYVVFQNSNIFSLLSCLQTHVSATTYTRFTLLICCWCAMCSGFPKEASQQPIKNKTLHEAAKGTVKVMHTGEGDNSILAVGLYDEEPVHFMDAQNNEVKWMQLSKQRWSEITNVVGAVLFHRLSIAHSYNWTMDGKL
jgi:hypothetical protein